MRYDSQDDLARAKAYYDDLGKRKRRDFFSLRLHPRRHSRQVNGQLPKDQADLLRKALSGPVEPVHGPTPPCRARSPESRQRLLCVCRRGK